MAKRAIDVLKSNFGVSQLYKYKVMMGEEVLMTIYWHPLTIAERESIQKSLPEGEVSTGHDFALSLMIKKALDVKGNRLFQEGDRASLRREVDSSILNDIQLAMMESGSNLKVEEAKAELKSEDE